MKKLLLRRLANTKPQRQSRDEFIASWNHRHNTAFAPDFGGFACPSCRGMKGKMADRRITCTTCSGKGKVPKSFVAAAYADEQRRHKTACAAWRRREKRLAQATKALTPDDLRLIVELLQRP